VRVSSPHLKFLLVALLLTAVQVALPLLFARTFHLDDLKAIEHPRSKGPATAWVQMVEYSNFTCPSCRFVQEDLNALLKQYKGKIFFSFRHLAKFEEPRSIHAHMASECASEQSAFWPYHDKLFQEQAVWNSKLVRESILLEYAVELGLDMDRFKACLQDRTVFERIRDDAIQGHAAGVTHTPTFIIDGQLFVGPTQLREKGIPFLKKRLGERAS